MSGGQRQAVAIARTRLADPKIVLGPGLEPDPTANPPTSARDRRVPASAVVETRPKVHIVPEIEAVPMASAASTIAIEARLAGIQQNLDRLGRTLDAQTNREPAAALPMAWGPWWVWVPGAPGKMVSMLEPMLRMTAMEARFEPSPMPIMAMTAPTPTMIPSMVRKVRGLFRVVAARASLIRSRIPMGTSRTAVLRPPFYPFGLAGPAAGVRNRASIRPAARAIPKVANHTARGPALA